MRGLVHKREEEEAWPMTNNTLLFSYHDINIYEKEKSFFYPGQWLNDVCIYYGLKLFETEELSSFAYSSVFLYFDPAVVSFLNLQVQDEEEYEELAHGLNIEAKVWLFVPINDNSSFEVLKNELGFRSDIRVFIYFIGISYGEFSNIVIN